MATFISGKTGWLKSTSGNTTTNYTMREWRMEINAAQADVSNFTSGGFAEFITGLVSGRVTARGPLDLNTQLTTGNTYTLNLGLGTSGNTNCYTTMTAVLTRVAPSTAVDQAGQVDIEFQTSGSFNTTFSA
jgi:hypothetical protein